MSKKKKIIIALSLLVFLVPVGIGGYLKFFHIGKEERIFMDAVQNALKADGDSVLIKDITNFEWDRVCLRATSSMDKYVSPTITKDKELAKQIAQYPKSITFLKEGEIVYFLGYRVGRKIQIQDKKYFFLNHAKDNYCQSRDEALIVSEVINTGCCGPVPEIILKSKEN